MPIIERKKIDPDKKIGNNIMQCVLDIAEGNKELNDVEMIVGGTSIPLDNLQGWKDKIAFYSAGPWSHCKVRAGEILMELVASKRIKQPMLDGNKSGGPLLDAKNYWFKSEDEIRYPAEKTAEWTKAGQDKTEVETPRTHF